MVDKPTQAKFCSEEHQRAWFNHQRRERNRARRAAS
jgi:hypothetical protein